MKIKRILIISGGVGFVIGLFFFVLTSLWVWNEPFGSIIFTILEKILWPVIALYPFVLFNPNAVFPNYIMVLLTIVYFCVIGMVIKGIIWLLKAFLI